MAHVYYYIMYNMMRRYSHDKSILILILRARRLEAPASSTGAIFYVEDTVWFAVGVVPVA